MPYDVKDMIEWYNDDANSSARLKYWLEPANRARNQYNNMVIRSDDPNEWIINATVVRMVIDAIKGMLIDAPLTPLVMGVNEDGAELEKLVVGWLMWRKRQLWKRTWLESWIENNLIEGVGCVDVEYDFTQWTATQRGSTKILYLNPRNVILDHRATHIDECTRKTVIYRMSKIEAQARWGDEFLEACETDFTDGTSYPSSSPKTDDSTRYYLGENTNEKFVRIARSLWKETTYVDYMFDPESGQEVELPTGHGTPGLVSSRQKKEVWMGAYHYGKKLLEGEGKPTLTGNDPIKISGAQHIEGSPYYQGQCAPILDLNVAKSALFTMMFQRAMKGDGYIDVWNMAYSKDKTKAEDFIAASNSPLPVVSFAEEFTNRDGSPADLNQIFRRIARNPITSPEMELMKALSDEAKSQSAVQNVQVGIFDASSPGNKAALAQQSANIQLGSTLSAIREGQAEILREVFAIDRITVTEAQMIPSMNAEEKQYISVNLVLPREAMAMRPKQEGETLFHDPTNPDVVIINPLWAGEFVIDVKIDSDSPQEVEARIARAFQLNGAGKLSDEDLLKQIPEYQNDPRYYLQRAKKQQMENLQLQQEAQANAMQQQADSQAQLAQQQTEHKMMMNEHQAQLDALLESHKAKIAPKPKAAEKPKTATKRK